MARSGNCKDYWSIYKDEFKNYLSDSYYSHLIHNDIKLVDIYYIYG